MSRRRIAALTAVALLVIGVLVVVLWPKARTHHETVPPTVPATVHQTVPETAHPPAAVLDLRDARMKEVALEVVSTAENSTTDWRQAYSYIEDLGDKRGYTAGLIGYCSGTGDMLELIEGYTGEVPHNALARYLPELRHLEEIYAAHNYRINDGSASVANLGPGFIRAWKQAARDPVFQTAQRKERDQVYFDPALALAQADGLGALGQFVYFDAAVNFGPAEDHGFQGIRNDATAVARTPAQGGNEAAYIRAFLDARMAHMKDGAHGPTDRVRVQREFLDAENLHLAPPLKWTMYGDAFAIPTLPGATN